MLVHIPLPIDSTYVVSHLRLCYKRDMIAMRKILFIACAIVVCVVSGNAGAQGKPPSFFHPAYRGVVDKTAMDKHYLLEFLPRFKRSECLVRIDLLFEGTEGERYRAPLSMLFKQYLWVHEPKAGLFHLGSDHPTANRQIAAYVQFADECDRRFEIAEAMADYASGADPRYKLRVSRDHILPGPDTMEADGAWIDDPDYVAKTWVLRRKANRGDGEAMFQIAETMNPYSDHLQMYITYLMAKNCLQPGKLKTEATVRAQKTLFAIP